MTEISNELLHVLSLKGRERLNIGGVTDVLCFDEQAVRLVTVSGELTVSGEGLHISHLQLETGDVHLCGRVDSMVYTSVQKHRPLLKRLFR